MVFREDDSWAGSYTIWEEGYRDKTYNLLKRFSEKDAETYIDYMEKWWDYFYPASLEWSFALLCLWVSLMQWTGLLMNPESGIKPHWMMMSACQLMRELFESPEVQALGIRGAQSAGVNPTAYGSALIGLCAHEYLYGRFSHKGRESPVCSRLSESYL